MPKNRSFKYLVAMLFSIAFVLSAGLSVFADEIGGTGSTGQGGFGGSNVYTFYYQYSPEHDAIELTVNTEKPVINFGNTTSHTYSNPSDQIPLDTNNPRLGRSLEDAINDMIQIGGYQLTVSGVKNELEELGYYDKGNGIWKYSGGYLTHISARRIYKKTHTISYNASGGNDAPSSQVKTEGVSLTLRYGKPTRTGYTFKGWTASIGGTYYPGGEYTHDQDGGTVTMTAIWLDETSPIGTIVAVPKEWSAQDGTVTITAQDLESGLDTMILQRYSYVTATWEEVQTWDLNGTNERITKTYIETNEGMFSYKVVINDKAGNSMRASSKVIYLDHSDPVISGLDQVNTDWTNVAPTIHISTSDYLMGTTCNGSGVVSVVIKDDAGDTVASGASTVSYTVQPNYEGVHTWYIEATDAVGHTSTDSVTTKYDITKPGIDGTEVTEVVNGVTHSGYCKDNIINQHIDDESSRSENGANQSSGIKSVILYQVTGHNRKVIYSDQTQKMFEEPDTHSFFDMYYEIPRTENKSSYYEIIVMDFAGNKTTKKLISQYSLLSWFHTSIDRSTYK